MSRFTRVFWGLILLGMGLAQAQDSPDDLLHHQLASARAHQALEGWPAALHQGKVFAPYSPAIEGHPWLDSLWQAGRVGWEGQVLGPVTLRYDIYQDRLLLRLPRQAPVILTDSLARAFWLGERHFVLATGTAPEGMPGMLRSGYHERAFAGGGWVLYIKHRKLLYSYHRSNTIEQVFRDQSRMYLHTGGEAYHLIRGKGSLRRALPAQRAALRQAYRTLGIQGRRLDRYSLVALLTALTGGS